MAYPSKIFSLIKGQGPLFLLFSRVLCCSVVFAQIEMGQVTGVVTDVSGARVANAEISLDNPLSWRQTRTVSDSQGQFHIQNVPYGTYVLHISAKGFTPSSKQFRIRSNVPVEFSIRLTVAVTGAEITVRPDLLQADTPRTETVIDESSIKLTPRVVRRDQLQALISTTPGWNTENDGLMHIRGVDDGTLFVVDGVPTPDRVDGLFAGSFNTDAITSMDVITGNIPAEFGDRSGAVVVIQPKSGLSSPLNGTLSLGGGSFDSRDISTTVGGGTAKWGLFFAGSGHQSDRFLDPVNPASLNNEGKTGRGFLRLDWAPNETDKFRVTALLGGTRRGVPNTFTQDLAGQDQQVTTRDQNFNLGWQHVHSARSFLEVNLFGRFSTFRLDPSANDTPVTAGSDRSLDNYGVNPSMTWIAGVHEFKIGGVFKRIPIDERFSFALTDPNVNDPASSDYNPNLAPYDLTPCSGSRTQSCDGTDFKFKDNRTGTYYAGYLQDDIRLKRLTANLGLRYDHNNLPATDSQLGPRIGLAYSIPESRTVFRISYNRVFYTPEYENILLGSSPAAAALVPPAIQASLALGGGVLLVRGERQNAFDAGFQQSLGSHLRLDVDFWQRQSHFAGDQDQFLNTGIVFPLAFQSGRFHGWNIRLDLAETAGVKGFVSLGHTRAVYVAPPVGGLFLDQGALDALVAGEFLIDHDQALQIQSGWTYDFRSSGFWIGTNVRYDSGLVTGVDPVDLAADPDNAFAAPFVRVHSGGSFDPNRIAPRTIWDFSAGVDLARYKAPLSIQFDLLNAFDKPGVYNIESVFGGTHVIPPRTLAARVRYRF